MPSACAAMWYWCDSNVGFPVDENIWSPSTYSSAIALYGCVSLRGTVAYCGREYPGQSVFSWEKSPVFRSRSKSPKVSEILHLASSGIDGDEHVEASEPEYWQKKLSKLRASCTMTITCSIFPEPARWPAAFARGVEACCCIPIGAVPDCGTLQPASAVHAQRPSAKRLKLGTIVEILRDRPSSSRARY